MQDLLVRFPNGVGAQVFLLAAQHSLETGEIVSSDTVPSIPGARRVTYFAATNQDGVGEAITMRAGVYVDLLSIFSAASGNAHPISPADAERLAEVQHAAMARAPGGRHRNRNRRASSELDDRHQEGRLGRHHRPGRGRRRHPGGRRGHPGTFEAAAPGAGGCRAGPRPARRRRPVTRRRG